VESDTAHASSAWSETPPAVRIARVLEQVLEHALVALELGVPRDSVTPVRRRRIRILSIATAAMLAIGIVSVIHYGGLGLRELAMAQVLTMIAALANLALMRATLRPELCGQIGMGLLASLLTFSNLTTGGFYTPNFAWFYVLPICGAVLLDTRGALVWTALTIGIAISFWLLPEFGIVIPSRIPSDAVATTGLFNRITAIIGIGTMAASFVVAQRRGEMELAAANESLSRESAYSQLIEHAAVSANEAASFEDAMRDGVARICTTMGWAVGFVWSVRDDGGLETIDIAYFSDPEFFVPIWKKLTPATMARGQGVSGRVAETGRPERVDDIPSTDSKALAHLAREAGLSGAFAVPVWVDGKVRAVLEFVSTRPLPPDDRLLEVFAHIGVQLGRAAERTALQDRLRQSQKMEAVGQLAAGLAHEINNPMSYVRSNLNLLFEQWNQFRSSVEKLDSRKDREAFDACEELFADCLEGVERTVRIVREVQEFSHIGDKRGEVDLAQVVEGALRVVLSRARPGIEIEQQIDPIPGVFGSVSQIGQVAVNLLVNAIHAVGESGRIRIVARREDDEAVLRVEDDGPGIRSEIREHLFEPFFTTKAVGEGTGLGLYVSYEIAKNHGGELRLATDVARGTAFELRLPVDPNA